MKREKNREKSHSSTENTDINCSSFRILSICKNISSHRTHGEYYTLSLACANINGCLSFRLIFIIFIFTCVSIFISWFQSVAQILYSFWMYVIIEARDWNGCHPCIEYIFINVVKSVNFFFAFHVSFRKFSVHIFSVY